MADDPSKSLRDMAEHRGLKLVKSRRRKPGTGDFGKFGLISAKGERLLGFGEDGFTASAADVEDYLRTGDAGTWQRSAKSLPERPRNRNDGEHAGAAAKAPRHARIKVALVREPEGPPAVEEGRTGPARPDPEVKLALRPAKPADASGLARLLGELNGISADKDRVMRHLAALRKARAGVQVAELGAMVGCVGWAVVPTLHRGPVGRITVLVVAADHRRQGIGTQLLAHAEAALVEQGCTLIEAMSDIEIKNAHNFFRSAKFDQASYRFARLAGTEASREDLT